jgi:hypothetical protein
MLRTFMKADIAQTRIEEGLIELDKALAAA